MKTTLNIFTLFLIIVGCNDATQKETAKIESGLVLEQFDSTRDSCTFLGDWILINQFNDIDLHFKKIRNIDTNQTWLKQIHFGVDKLTFNYIKTVPTCGTGLITIDSCYSFRKDSLVELYFEGWSTEGTFKIHNMYRSVLNTNCELHFYRIQEINNKFRTIQELTELN